MPHLIDAVSATDGVDSAVTGQLIRKHPKYQNDRTERHHIESALVKRAFGGRSLFAAKAHRHHDPRSQHHEEAANPHPRLCGDVGKGGEQVKRQERGIGPEQVPRRKQTALGHCSALQNEKPDQDHGRKRPQYSRSQATTRRPCGTPRADPAPTRAIQGAEP